MRCHRVIAGSRTNARSGDDVDAPRSARWLPRSLSMFWLRPQGVLPRNHEKFAIVHDKRHPFYELVKKAA